MENYKFSMEQINNMKHCIGFERSEVTGRKNRKMKAYRNYYTTSDNNEGLDSLVEQGLMVKREHTGCGKNPQIYFVSEEGFKFLSDLTNIEITEME